MNGTYDLLLGVLVGGIGLATFLLVRYFWERQASPVQRRLQPEGEESGILLSGARRTEPGVMGKFDTWFDELIQRAGIAAPSEEVMAIIFLVAVVLAGGMYIWKQDLGFLTGALLLGLMIPLVVLWLLRGRYRGQLQSQLPDALYLMARSLRAGMSMEASISLLANEGVKPMGTEFKRCDAALQLGLPLVTALQAMADRIKLMDFNSFVSTVGYHQSTGGNLPLLLDRLAASARDHNQFRGQFLAATAQGRITAIGLAIAGPALLLAYILLQPEHIEPFLSDPKGWTLLFVVLVMEIIGVVWIYNILKIDY